MELYSKIRNISGKNNEEELKKAIFYVREKLSNLGEERMCKVYSSFLLKELLQRHVPARLINTLDLGLEYEHQFILVAKSETDGGYFIVDLTFSQFQQTKNCFSKLLENGYQTIENNNLIDYLNIVSNGCIKANISLDKIFFSPLSSNFSENNIKRHI